VVIEVQSFHPVVRRGKLFLDIDSGYLVISGKAYYAVNAGFFPITRPLTLIVYNLAASTPDRLQIEVHRFMILYLTINLTFL